MVKSRSFALAQTGFECLQDYCEDENNKDGYSGSQSVTDSRQNQTGQPEAQEISAEQQETDEQMQEDQSEETEAAQESQKIE